jgi:Holliday junction resolvase RusA-like endonuclease
MDWILFNIEPVAASRPRFNTKTGTAYTASKYDKFKKALILLCKRIPKGDYFSIEMEFYFAYPKSTPKKNLVDGALHQKKSDIDNVCKGVLDALEQAGVLNNDSKISDLIARKRYTTNPKGFIKLKLNQERSQ